MELTVVVPTFNERDNIVPLVERLIKVLAGTDWEVVFVDDDSPDGTSVSLRKRIGACAVSNGLDGEGWPRPASRAC